MCVCVCVCRGGAKQRGVYDEYMVCACWETRTCAKPDERCNCDTNDETRRMDAGDLTYKPDLPVKQFRAGDTGRWLGISG